jgi:hypothetical protein
LATSAATVAAIASGCGGSTSGGSSNDSGAPDVTADHYTAPEAGKEAAPEAAMEAAPCVPDAQITSIPVPDGSVPGTDASAATCISCVEAACPTLIATCNMTCGCPEAFDAFEACVNAGGSLITCAETDLATAGLSPTDLTCGAGCLTTACGITLPNEGGAPESSTGEASTDAPSDAVGQ